MPRPRGHDCLVEILLKSAVSSNKCSWMLIAKLTYFGAEFETECATFRLAQDYSTWSGFGGVVWHIPFQTLHQSMLIILSLWFLEPWKIYSISFLNVLEYYFQLFCMNHERNRMKWSEVLRRKALTLAVLRADAPGNNTLDLTTTTVWITLTRQCESPLPMTRLTAPVLLRSVGYANP